MLPPLSRFEHRRSNPVNMKHASTCAASSIQQDNSAPLRKPRYEALAPLSRSSARDAIEAAPIRNSNRSSQGRNIFSSRQHSISVARHWATTDNWGQHLAGSAIRKEPDRRSAVTRMEWQSMGSLPRRMRAVGGMTGVRLATRTARRKLVEAESLSDVEGAGNADGFNGSRQCVAGPELVCRLIDRSAGLSWTIDGAGRHAPGIWTIAIQEINKGEP